MYIFLLPMQLQRHGQSQFENTLMDDLLDHLKAIDDPGCVNSSMGYLQYMEEVYSYKGKVGVHLFEKSFGTQVLTKYTDALVSLFDGRPFEGQKPSKDEKTDLSDFKSVVNALFSLDDSEWRPLVKALRRVRQKVARWEWHQYSLHQLQLGLVICFLSFLYTFLSPIVLISLCYMMQKALGCLLQFMYNLEHMAVLLALSNVKGAVCGPLWRKKQYGKIIQLVKDELDSPGSFVAAINSVSGKMWMQPHASEVNKQQPLDKQSCLQLLSSMDLYTKGSKQGGSIVTSNQFLLHGCGRTTDMQAVSDIVLSCACTDSESLATTT